MLATPSWSVASLLSPRAKQADAAPPISPSQLRHLLRLSALSAPATAEEEESMMSTLVAQLHFVKEMQKVNTTGIKPLKAIRDETSQAEREQEVTLETLKDALAREEVVGKFYKRIRRKPDMASPNRLPEQCVPLQHAQRKAGKFFVVNSGKGSND
jgi:Asp-tRNA(Asn)/Glu-tRNA(Gln) amidotransferase C subunit